MVWSGDWAEVLFDTIILSSLDVPIACNSPIDQEGRPRWQGKVLAQQDHSSINTCSCRRARDFEFVFL